MYLITLFFFCCWSVPLLISFSFFLSFFLSFNPLTYFDRCGARGLSAGASFCTSQDRHRNNELCKQSQDSNHGLDYMGLKSLKWKRFFSSPGRPFRLWGALDTGVHSRGQLDQGMMLTTYLHVAPRFKKSAATRRVKKNTELLL